MKKNGCAAAALIFLLLAMATSGWGENEGGQGPSGAGLYKIKEGDTLWDISRNELGDPWQWPFIWKENPGIKNPDKIYPGKVLTIPLRPVSGEEGKKAPSSAAVIETPPAAPPPAPAKPEAKSEKRRPAVYYAGKEVPIGYDDMLSSGFIAKEVPALAVVMPPPGGRVLITAGDELYMEASGPVGAGEKLLVTGVSEVNDPVTGRFAGYLVEPHGIARSEGDFAGQDIKGKQGRVLRAEVSKVFHGITPGDVIIRYRAPEIPADTERKPRVEGHVLALKNHALIGADMSFVYLDKGASAGLKPGDLLQTVNGPEINALLQVLSVEPDSATALVRKSNTVVSPGDEFTWIGK